MKNKKNFILTIILSLVGVAILAVAIYFIKDSYQSEAAGQIQIVLIDLDGNIESDKKISFEEGDKLADILEANYDNVTFEDGMLMSIEGFTTAHDWSTFISIYVDDEMSIVGLSDIVFIDGTKISLVMTEFIYE